MIAFTTDPGLGADDLITAGDGNNTILGGDGADSITSGAGTTWCSATTARSPRR